VGQKILVVEDDRAVRNVLQSYLTARGFAVEVAGSCQEGRDVFSRQRPDLAVIDYQLPDGTALNLLPQLRSADPSLAIVILTGFGSIELAVRAIKEGADQFLTKPVELSTLSIILQRLIEKPPRQSTARGRQDDACARAGRPVPRGQCCDPAARGSGPTNPGQREPGAHRRRDRNRQGCAGALAP